MAHLWVKDSGEWAVLELLGDQYALTGNPLKPVQRRGHAPAAEIAFMLRRRDVDGEHWFALARAQINAVFINGIPLFTGIRILRDRDELRFDGIDRIYFSTESLASKEPFPGAAQAMYCPRCKQEITPQADAVKCPGCEAWHHQSEELPCWSYSERCALCDQPTNFDTGYRWTPDSL